MIAPQSAVIPTVANGHGQQPPHAYPPGWLDIWPVLRQFLITEHPPGYTQEILMQCERLADMLAPYPMAVTKRDLENLTEQPWVTGNQKTALGYLCLTLIDMGTWPKEFLPTYTCRNVVQARLLRRWRNLAEGFLKRQQRMGVPKDCWQRWSTWITLFLWYSEFDPVEALEPDTLHKSWGEFTRFLSQWKRDSHRWKKALHRAFASFWNHAVEQGELCAEMMPEERVATTFWSWLQEPVRVELHRRYPVVHGVRGSNDSWLYVLRYAFCLLGFSRHGSSRPLKVSNEEVLTLRTRLETEGVRDTLAQVCAEVKTILGEPVG